MSIILCAEEVATLVLANRGFESFPVRLGDALNAGTDLLAKDVNPKQVGLPL